MIFGIKTKKDKQIEELQVINKELQNALEEEKMRKQSTQFIQMPVETVVFRAEYDVYDENGRLRQLPESKPAYIKSVLATQLIHAIEDHLDIEIERVPYMNFTKFTTKLEVVIKK